MSTQNEQVITVVNDQPRTVRQAAKELNLSMGTIRTWIVQRRIGHVRLGRTVRIPPSEIRRVLSEGFKPATVGLGSRVAGDEPQRAA